jgi:hypothetical protein
MEGGGNHVQTHRLMGGIYEGGLVMDSGAMTYIPNFIKNSLDIQKLIGGLHIQTHRQQSDFISLFMFLQNKGSRLWIES